MPRYHLRRAEKAITDEATLLEIIDSQNHVTLAMCNAGEPYLVTVNYGYEADRRCFYFHCAQEGKKIDVLTANPQVWGQVLDDFGYLDGQCDHAFRSVQFAGTVTFVESIEEKRHALTLMIHQLESDPQAVIARQLKAKSVKNVNIGRIDVGEMSGKQNAD